MYTRPIVQQLFSRKKIEKVEDEREISDSCTESEFLHFNFSVGVILLLCVERHQVGSEFHTRLCSDCDYVSNIVVSYSFVRLATS